jgi:hypothetical protein
VFTLLVERYRVKSSESVKTKSLAKAGFCAQEPIPNLEICVKVPATEVSAKVLRLLPAASGCKYKVFSTVFVERTKVLTVAVACKALLKE